MAKQNAITTENKTQFNLLETRRRPRCPPARAQNEATSQKKRQKEERIGEKKKGRGNEEREP